MLSLGVGRRPWAPLARSKAWTLLAQQPSISRPVSGRAPQRKISRSPRSHLRRHRWPSRRKSRLSSRHNIRDRAIYVIEPGARRRVSQMREGIKRNWLRRDAEPRIPWCLDLCFEPEASGGAISMRLAVAVEVAAFALPLFQLAPHEPFGQARRAHLDGLLLEIVTEQHPFPSGWCTLCLSYSGHGSTSWSGARAGSGVNGARPVRFHPHAVRIGTTLLSRPSTTLRTNSAHCIIATAFAARYAAQL